MKIAKAKNFIYIFFKKIQWKRSRIFCLKQKVRIYCFHSKMRLSFLVQISFSFLPRLGICLNGLANCHNLSLS